VRAHLQVEAIAVHADIPRCIAKAEDARERHSGSTALACIELQQRHNRRAPTSPLDPDEASVLKARERAIFCIAVETELLGRNISEFHS